VDGETGFLVQFEPSGDAFGTPADPQGFAAKIAGKVNELLATPALAKRLGQAGRQRVLQHFTWRAVAQKTMQVYAKAMQRARLNSLRSSTASWG